METWTVGYFSGQTGIRALEAGADEYGRIVDLWSSEGSVRAERRIWHLASVTGKQRTEQVMSEPVSSRSAERDLLFFRPAAMAMVDAIGGIVPGESSTQNLKTMLKVSQNWPCSDDSWASDKQCAIGIGSRGTKS